MSDWKLLSFYTTNATSPFCLGNKTELGFGNGEPVGVTSCSDTEVHAAQELFCTGSNISSSVAYLNQELQLLGLSSITCNKKGHPDVVSILNRTYDLLRLYQHLFSTRDELENRIHRLNSDCDHQKSCVARANRQHEALDKALAQETEKLRQLMSRHKVVSAKVKTDKEEIKCLQSVMHHKELQFNHELKKKEREINRLKDRLHQLLMDKNPDRKVGMDLMHPLQNSDGRRSQWKTGLSKQEEELYQLLIHNYEVKHQELVLENTELRNCLLVVHQELLSSLKLTAESPAISDKEVSDTQDHLFLEDEADDECEEIEEFQDSLCELHEGCYQMPYDMIGQQIEQGFKKAFMKIRLRIKKAQEKKSEESDNAKSRMSVASVNDQPSVQLENLKTKIAKYKDVIQQQEHLIKQFLETNSASFLQESHLLHERNMLEKKKKLFVQEKAHFEEERRLFTEAAVKLSQERQAVQEERIQFLKEHFLNITPFREHQTPNRILQKEGGVRLLPPTPNFSPAPDGKFRTPTTEQLFQALGLTDFHRLERGRSSVPPVSKETSRHDSPAASETAAPTKGGVRKTLFSSSASTESELSQKTDSH